MGENREPEREFDWAAVDALMLRLRPVMPEARWNFFAGALADLRIIDSRLDVLLRQARFEEQQAARAAERRLREAELEHREAVAAGQWVFGGERIVREPADNRSHHLRHPGAWMPEGVVMEIPKEWDDG